MQLSEKVDNFLINLISKSSYWSYIGRAAQAKRDEPLIALIHGHITNEQFDSIERGEITLAVAMSNLSHDQNQHNHHQSQ